MTIRGWKDLTLSPWLSAFSIFPVLLLVFVSLRLFSSLRFPYAIFLSLETHFENVTFYVLYFKWYCQNKCSVVHKNDFFICDYFKIFIIDLLIKFRQFLLLKWLTRYQNETLKWGKIGNRLVDTRRLLLYKWVRFTLSVTFVTLCLTKLSILNADFIVLLKSTKYKYLHYISNSKVTKKIQYFCSLFIYFLN